MALLHELLCGSGDLSQIDLAEYTRQLAGHLLRAYGVDQRIELSTDLDPVHLSLEASVPYGLITNELIVNALRHGFPGERAGEVRVSLYQHKDRVVRLIVRDDGVGLPEETVWTSGKSLGFRLVRLLADQLGAQIEVHPRDPTEVQVTFRSSD